jgi:hypothetical protein
MENEGKLKRVMNVREYFYVVAETEGGDSVSGCEQLKTESASDGELSSFACERSEMRG